MGAERGDGRPGRLRRHRAARAPAVERVRGACAGVRSRGRSRPRRGAHRAGAAAPRQRRRLASPPARTCHPRADRRAQARAAEADRRPRQHRPRRADRRGRARRRAAARPPQGRGARRLPRRAAERIAPAEASERGRYAARRRAQRPLGQGDDPPGDRCRARGAGDMSERFLKYAPWHAPAASQQIRARVSDMLSTIEREGERAVRRYSEELDDWSPASFVLEASELREAKVDQALAGHIAFALEQVRGFARAQRNTLHELELETLPGVTLGHRHIPVGAVGAYVPGGRYPMLASALMTVAVAKTAGVAHVTACAPPREGKGIDAAMLLAIAA